MLSKLLGSRLRARVLGWLFAHPDERYFVRQLTTLLEEDSANLSRELLRLESLGIVVSAKEGRQKYYRANRDCAVFEELRGLALKTTGLADILREALLPLGRQIVMAMVYGSHASGRATSTSDVDLLVVGDADETALHAAVGTAEKRLQRSVNYTYLAPMELRRRKREKGGFLARIMGGPKLVILGSPNAV
ncbi:MAG: hypothetical protein A2V83_03255 [Nitrospirae bacterium RBG_16_64_22]|nr:MAG: hypothetical protein A2V83_03255 [Nitrospirae bacterium RBG_16_64_22]